MGLRSWKRVIFAWVQKCGFVDEHFLTLEQSNINIFFLRYLEYDHMEIFLDTVSTQGSDRATPLIQFLKDVYPDFCPNLDRSGNLDRTDHLMVYTLMLHYACVIKKSEKYQLICTELSESMQRSIASFLRHIVDSQKITRNCLKDALQTSPKFVHPRTIASPDTSISNSHTVVASIPQTPGTPVTLDTASPQTPTETPLHTSGDSPLPICSTPMRERERVSEADWRQMRQKLSAAEIRLAETEIKLTSTERKLATAECENSSLDEFLQEISHANSKVKNENKELKAEIGLLKEKVKIFEERATDEDAEGQMNYEHLKLGHLKEITARDKLLSETQEQLQDAINERSKEENRVRELEEQLKVCFDQISMLDLKVKELRESVMAKDMEISCLERDKQDLTQCLNVLRQESQGRREVLNSTGDLLDTSLSPGSVPENLASSVIDKQLREKEMELCQLKEEFVKLQTHIYDRLNSPVKLEPPPNPVSCFEDPTQLLEVNCAAIDMRPQVSNESEVNKLVKNIKTLRVKLDKKKKDSSTQTDADSHVTKLEEIEDLIAEKERFKDLQAVKIVELTAEVKELMERVEILSMEKSQLEHSQQKLKISEKSLASECAKLTYSMEEHRMNGSQLQSSIDALTANKIELEESLVQPARHIEDNEQIYADLMAQQDMEQARNLSHELALEHAQNAANLKKMEAKVVEWRQKYESILKKSLANEAETNENERKRQDLVESSNISMTEMRSKIDALEEKYRESQTNYGQLLFERNNRDVQYENERIEIELKLANCCRELDDRNDSHALLLKKYENRMEELNALKEEHDTLMEVSETFMKERDFMTQERDTFMNELDILKQERDTLRQEHDTLMEVRDIFMKELDTLKQERDTLKQERDTLMEELNTLKQEHDTLMEMRDSFMKERDIMTQERDTFMKELDTLKQERDTLMEVAEQHKMVLSEFQKILAQANNVTKEKELLHRELIELQKKTEQDAETITIMKDHKDLLLVKRNTLDEQHQKELVNVDLMLANCRQKLDEQNESYAMLLKERDTLMEATEQNTKELSRVQQKLEQQQKQQENMQEELKQKDAQIEALRKEKEMMRKSERTVRKDLNVLINKTDEKEAHLNQEIGSLNLQLKRTNQRLEQLVLQTETHDGEIAQLQVKIAEDGQALEAAKQEQLRLQMELQSRRELMENIEQAHKLENKSLKQQAELLQCTLQEILQVKMELQSNLLKQQDEHNKQLKLYEDQLEESENRYAFLQVNMTAQQKTSEELQIQLSQQLNVTKKDLADAMERLNATYTAAAEEEGLPDRSTLQQNCQVLQAKYQEAKKKIDELHVSLKDQRNEMEGKLEKMKNKMPHTTPHTQQHTDNTDLTHWQRTLYTAEVTRMKEKQEREAAHAKAELEAITCQNTKFEEHTRKLSNQIVRLNERILEQQKQHAITTTQLRHMQATATSEATRSTSSLSTLTVSGSATTASTATAATEDWQPFKRPSAPSSNLAMEDEEGEVFNNTYLTDLKLGRVPDITAEELNYRNSLQPPHLRSTYAAQYDVGSQDEDLKDGPHSLDDSMSALLSSSASTGARKKTMGTHYKRPGPPTPSKNGGRLSFGSSEPPREILRETCENNGNSKTPTRFKMFTSRFSIGSSTSGSSGLPRDENSPPKRRLSNMFKRK
ncbi:centromere-associated protein E-like isoform X4 [Drosophila guanche]|uniref:centromere-associated protein E-like isoform X4 n=1 Tax=Drosophila guanche TaxID=7266 RepID=UPI0014724219|nr:centromere-associated protein E-like isoform X4 [Drosophila guanche]